MALCTKCSGFDIQAFARGNFPGRGYPLHAVVRAATRDNCSFCSMLLEHLDNIHGASLHFYLPYGLHKGDQEALTFSGRCRDLMHSIKQQLASIVKTPWIHFSVRRSSDDDRSGGESLDIVEIVASMSEVPNEQERRSTTYSSRSVTWDWIWNRDLKPDIHLRVAADLGTPASESGDIRGTLSFDHSTWSELHYEAIRDWCRNCRNSHGHCNRTLASFREIDANDAPLPSRCVEFEFVDPYNIWTSAIRWRLRETQGQRGAYIALSHRWAPETEEAKTMEYNYQHRITTWTQGQGYSRQARGKLSPLFLDAGRVACHLGIRYVWIDSICIVQDDKDDWDRESTKMAQYYQFSWLTIAVAAASETRGIFRRQHAANTPRVTRLPYLDKKGEQSGHFYVQAESNLHWTNDYEKNVIESDLLQRGWVYQEWHLSRRILVISERGLFLQCESEPPSSLDGYTVVKSRKRDHDLFNQYQESRIVMNSSDRQIWRAWVRVVEQFSGLHISFFEKDRLIALNGIANEYQHAFDDQYERASEYEAFLYAHQYQLRNMYICGLWTGWLHGLLWESHWSETENVVRVKGFPTWSWMSIATKPSTDDTGASQEAPIHGREVQWANPFDLRDESDVCSLDFPIVVKCLEEDDWIPDFATTEEYTYNGKDTCDKRFAMLPIRDGRLTNVLLGCRFDDRQDVDVAANMTAHNSDFGRSGWRRVSLASSPDTIIGWASVDHPSYQSDEACLAAPIIRALAICRISKVSGGYGFGHLSGYSSAFKVLFVSETRDALRENCYERVGVGRLFGDTVDEVFKDAEETSIYLL